MEYLEQRGVLVLEGLLLKLCEWKLCRGQVCVSGRTGVVCAV